MKAYGKGYLAGLAKKDREPPKDYTDDQKAAWLRGFENAWRISGRRAMKR